MDALGLTGDELDPLERLAGDAASWAAARRILDHDPRPGLRAAQLPLLAVFGAADDIVPVSASVAAFLRLCRPGAPHGRRAGWRRPPSPARRPADAGRGVRRDAPALHRSGSAKPGRAGARGAERWGDGESRRGAGMDADAPARRVRDDPTAVRRGEARRCRRRWPMGRGPGRRSPTRWEPTATRWCACSGAW